MDSLAFFWAATIRNMDKFASRSRKRFELKATTFPNLYFEEIMKKKVDDRFKTKEIGSLRTQIVFTGG